MSIKKNLLRAAALASLAGLVGTAQPASAAWITYNFKIQRLTFDSLGTGNITVIPQGTLDLCPTNTKETAAYVIKANTKVYDALSAALMSAYLSNSEVSVQTSDTATSCELQYFWLGRK